MTPVKVSKVFIAGGQPGLTYVNRGSATAATTLEESIQAYLDAGHKALTVTGPTKSGKTVLCRTVLGKEDAVWLSGGNVGSESDFWAQINDALDVPESETAAVERTKETTVGGEVSGSGGVPLVGKAEAKGQLSNASGSSHSKTATRVTNQKTEAVKQLAAADKPLVIDDFHYIERNVQKAIVRALKTRYLTAKE